MLSIKDKKSEVLENALSEQLKKDMEQPAINEDDLFVLADYDDSAAEKIGYSNYSYWHSTLRVFLKNRVAMFLLIVLVTLLTFTVIQPHLPGQYGATVIINRPFEGIQIENQSPALSTVYANAPAGTVLNLEEGYYASDNILVNIPRRREFTVLEYGEEWCRIQYTEQASGEENAAPKEHVGYVINNDYSRLELPDDPSAVPYTARSRKALNLYSEPVQLYYAVHNILASFKSDPKATKKDTFTVLEYSEDWIKVEYKGKPGYVKNDFNTVLEGLPAAPEKVPYETSSDEALKVYATQSADAYLDHVLDPQVKFTVTAYSDAWLTVEYNHPELGAKTGYVRNKQQTPLEGQPEDVKAVPYDCTSPEEIVVYAKKKTSADVKCVIPAGASFTITTYAEDWYKIRYQDAELGSVTGYVRNNFQTKLETVPTDPYAVPYDAYSFGNIRIHRDPIDYSNKGNALYAPVNVFVAGEDKDTIVAAEDVDLLIMPTGRPFLFGTNDIGQDLWALVWSGTRTSLFIGFVVALTEAFIGILVGVLWGYVRQLDRILTEIYNVIDNIPNTIILILISYILKPSMQTLIFAMCLTGWLGMARFIRNQILIIRDRDYNLASRCLGTSTPRIIFKNLLPYLVSVIMLRVALSIPGAIGSEVFITYIGLGLPADTPSLGNLINVGRGLVGAPDLMYQLIFPAIVLSIVTISFYIIGNAFADAADPKNHM